MKNLFKLFPVALAAFAMASCSSDDLNVAGEGELTFSPDKLLVQIEGDGSDEATRGGYVTNIYNYSIYSALAFDNGDKLKVYHDATSWKPEIWTADNYEQYKNATGTSAFKLAGSTIQQSEDAYGIYPSTASVFGNENRTSIQYDLSELAFVKYGVDGNKTYTGTTGTGAITKYYQAKFPLWGVKAAGAQVMTMKHLAGILRVDVADVTYEGTSPLPTADDQYKYVIIYSASKKLTGKIKTAADLLVPADAEALVPADFMTATPKLEVEASTNTAPSTAVPLTEDGAKAVDNVIIIRIDKNTTDKHLFAFVPVLPEIAAGDVSVYITDALASSVTTVDLSFLTHSYTLDASVINGCNDAYKAGGATPYAGQTTVQRGVTYKINDDSTNKNTTAKTPFELAKGIIAADKAAYRDFEITFTQPINVKNNDSSTQNYYLDLSNTAKDYLMSDYPNGWDLKHNVTVNFTLQESTDAGTTPSVLYIKTPGNNGQNGDKTLTLNITKGATEIDSIVILTGHLKNPLVLKSATSDKLPKIHIRENNDDLVTLVSGTNNLRTGSDMKIKTGQNAVDNVDALVLSHGVKKVTIDGGRLSGIYFDGATNEQIAGDVTIETTGNVGINAVDFANMPKTTISIGNYVDKFDLNFTSKWTGDKASIFEETTFKDGSKTLFEHVITTAAQLGKMIKPNQTYHVVGEYDLDGDNQTWTSLTGANQSILGSKNVRYGASKTATTGTTSRNLTGQATIKNLNGENGLLASWTPNTTSGYTISNFKFDGTNVIKKTAGTKLGLLVGEVDMSTASVLAATIRNISLTGTTTIQDATVGKNASCVAIGGVIGKVSGAVNALQLANIQVNNQTSVYGFKYIGGIVGEVAGKIVFGAQSKDGATDKFGSTSVYASDDVYNKSRANLTTILVASAPASPNLPTVGQFFGGASAIANDGDVTILGALTKLQTARKSSITGVDWGYYLPDANYEYWKWLAYLQYDEIGHCGYTVTANAVVVDSSIKKIYNLTRKSSSNKYETQTTLAPYVGTAAPTDPASGIKYFGYVIQPFE